ncbi:hypothetical protein DPMN_029745 [Dreissena polymorpha]|uniref:Uncharacterized protein n=2 Tax=Dreissena polymorpha TaxID=45954 RepID=A0A9D4LWZ4_DREPO|nr:hypothetical protein DPMN_029745 [Dreissena polymorpha]
MEHTSRQDTGEYLCIASNGLGNDSKSIYVDIIITDPHTDGFSWINICIYAACLIIIIVLAVSLCKSRFSNRIYSRSPKVKTSHTVSLEMVTQSHIEPNNINELTMLETPSTDSVHFYETIPPSPIADVSFDTVSGGVDTIVIHTMDPTEPGRYESLGQRDFSLYNTIDLN